MPPVIHSSDLVVLLPAIVFGVGAMVVLLSEVFLGKNPVRHYQPVVCAITCVVAALASLPTLDAASHPVFSGMGQSDAFSGLVSLMVAVGLLVSTLVAASFLHRHHVERGEFYALALFAASGMSLLALSTDLVMIFISLEVMSVAVYALTAYLRRGARPAEAAFKYFILGAFSSAVYLYGAALLYGATGRTQLMELAHVVEPRNATLFAAGVVFVAAGFAFKVAAVPFHMWTPDVYEGAPTPVTAFMAVGVKAAAFAALLRVVVVALPNPMGTAVWGHLLETLAVLTMVVGNLLAVPQRNVKRMLAYSSIAHAGYLLLGVAAARGATAESATSGVLFYLFAYTATAAGAFAIVAALERDDPESLAAWDLDRFAGLARRRPGMALACTIFMASLAGIPPFAGFVGKLYVFRAAVDAGLTTSAVIGVLTSVVGAYYYLKVVVYMYMRPTEPNQTVAAASMPLSAAVWLAALLTVWLGIGPSTLADLARTSTLTVSKTAPGALTLGE